MKGKYAENIDIFFVKPLQSCEENLMYFFWKNIMTSFYLTLPKRFQESRQYFSPLTHEEKKAN